MLLVSACNTQNSENRDVDEKMISETSTEDEEQRGKKETETALLRIS